jgi:hypothetical protein
MIRVGDGVYHTVGIDGVLRALGLGARPGCILCNSIYHCTMNIET